MDEHSAGTVAGPVTTDDAASPAGGERSPVVADDLFQMRYATNARIAADGRHVAFVRTSVAPAGDGYVSEISGSRSAMASPNSSAPGHSPVSGRGQRSWRGRQATRILLSSLAGAPLVRLPGPIRELAWSPDGRRLGCVVALEGAAHPTSAVHRVRTARYKLDGLGLTYATSGRDLPGRVRERSSQFDAGGRRRRSKLMFRSGW